jgi:hypothetical protein
METGVIQRPNGKAYRPRKVIGYLAGEDSKSVVVLGTHDIARAQVLADELVRIYVDSRETAADPVLVWWRDGFECGQLRWIADEVRGRAGVWFRDIVETGPL